MWGVDQDVPGGLPGQIRELEPVELRRIIGLMKAKVEKRKGELWKAELQDKKEMAGPANRKNVRPFGTLGAEA